MPRFRVKEEHGSHTCGHTFGHRKEGGGLVLSTKTTTTTMTAWWLGQAAHAQLVASARSKNDKKKKNDFHRAPLSAVRPIKWKNCLFLHSQPTFPNATHLLRIFGKKFWRLERGTWGAKTKRTKLFINLKEKQHREYTKGNKTPAHPKIESNQHWENQHPNEFKNLMKNLQGQRQGRVLLKKLPQISRNGQANNS